MRVARSRARVPWRWGVAGGPVAGGSVAGVGDDHRYKAALFAEEMLGVLVAPLILCFSLPACARDVLAFVRENTVEVCMCDVEMMTAV